MMGYGKVYNVILLHPGRLRSQGSRLRLRALPFSRGRENGVESDQRETRHRRRRSPGTGDLCS